MKTLGNVHIFIENNRRIEKMSTFEERKKLIAEFIGPRTPEEIKEWYSKYSNVYEEDMKLLEYSGPEIGISEFLKLNLPTNIRILDIGSGTGQTGQLLKNNGYTNIDAMDASPEMLEIAKQKNCYKNLFECFITKDNKLPIDDNIYDAVILVGCLCPGHVRWNSFPQIIRVVKPGGTVFWLVRNSQAYAEKDPDFQNGHNERIIESLCEQKLWQNIAGYPKRVENYLMGSDGNVYAMKVL